MIDGVSFFSKLKKVDASTYRDEFTSFIKSAKRLELLPTYSVNSEHAAFQAFLSHTDIPPFNNGWHDILVQARNRGASIYRLRGIPLQPTPYLRFEILAGYGNNAVEGEQIRFQQLTKIEAAPRGCAPLLDFWAFDDERVYAILYDTFGVYLGAMRADPESSSHLIQVFDDLFASGKSLEWASVSYAAHHD